MARTKRYRRRRVKRNDPFMPLLLLAGAGIAGYYLYKKSVGDAESAQTSASGRGAGVDPYSTGTGAGVNPLSSGTGAGTGASSTTASSGSTETETAQKTLSASADKNIGIQGLYYYG